MYVFYIYKFFIFPDSIIHLDIEKMLTSAHLFAELGNRAKPNIHDITRSLENVGIQINTFQEYLATHINDNETGSRFFF